MAVKKLLKDVTNEELLLLLEKWWKSPGTGIPNVESTVIQTEILRRSIEEQKKANKLQFWLNLIFGLATIAGTGLALISVLNEH